MVRERERPAGEMGKGKGATRALLERGKGGGPKCSLRQNKQTGGGTDPPEGASESPRPQVPRELFSGGQPPGGPRGGRSKFAS